jgi:hypothetical protein
MMRYKDTAWSAPWFLALGRDLQFCWQFLLDHADAAGFVNLELHGLLVSALGLDLAAAAQAFAERVRIWNPTLWQIKGFFPTQYPRDYSRALGGAQIKAFNDLKRFASLWGPSVVAEAFNGVPSWPEFEPKAPEGGGDIPPSTPGRPQVDLGITGKARQGRAGQGPPLQSVSKTVIHQDAPAPASEPVNEVTSEKLLFQALRMDWESSGHIHPDFPPFVRQKLLEVAAQVGAESVGIALRAFLAGNPVDPSPKAFGRQISSWLERVPAGKRRCHGPHTYEGHDVARTDFDNGPRARGLRCGWCGHTEWKGGTVEAATYKPVCVHTWAPMELPKGISVELAAEYAATEVCSGCGETRQGVNHA